MVDRKEKRLRKYKQLKKAGYSSMIANKYKDYAQKHVDSLCDIKQDSEKYLQDRVTKALGKTL